MSEILGPSSVVVVVVVVVDGDKGTPQHAWYFNSEYSALPCSAYRPHKKRQRAGRLSRQGPLCRCGRGWLLLLSRPWLVVSRLQLDGRGLEASRLEGRRLVAGQQVTGKQVTGQEVTGQQSEQVRGASPVDVLQVDVGQVPVVCGPVLCDIKYLPTRPRLARVMSSIGRHLAVAAAAAAAAAAAVIVSNIKYQIPHSISIPPPPFVAQQGSRELQCPLVSCAASPHLPAGWSQSQHSHPIPSHPSARRRGQKAKGPSTRVVPPQPLLCSALDPLRCVALPLPLCHSALYPLGPLPLPLSFFSLCL